MNAVMAGYFHYIKGYNVGVIDCDYATQAVITAEKMMEKSTEQPDIILFDLPRTLNSEGILSTLSMMDYTYNKNSQQSGWFPPSWLFF